MTEEHPAYLTLEQELNDLDLREAVMTDPTASHWLKRAVVELWERDVVDALNDVEILMNLLTSRRLH